MTLASLIFCFVILCCFTYIVQGAATEEAVSAQEIEALIEQRKAAKLAGDYPRADEIREQLLSAGVVLEDSREGTRWKRKTDQ